MPTIGIVIVLAAVAGACVLLAAGVIALLRRDRRRRRAAALAAMSNRERARAEARRIGEQLTKERRKRSRSATGNSWVDGDSSNTGAAGTWGGGGPMF